ncbi:hypothetical protein BGX24_003387 [Mortierella sp. AD032]|nr:hypothetical protein BGX24_003387 [Mortierella sp. AD032]
MEPQRAHQDVFYENQNQSQKNHILKLENQLQHMSVECQQLREARDHLHGAYKQLEQSNDDLTRKFKKKARQYEDLDRKYMDLARALQVTEDDRSTINKQLELVSLTIENLVIRGRGIGSVNLNRDAAIHHFRSSKLLQDFPVQELQLDSFHLNLLMEAAMMEVLMKDLFVKPLQCIFDMSHEFAEICEWMQVRGSRAAERWRQELCILIAQDGEEMARRKEKEVNKAFVELKDLVSSVYGNVDTSMSDNIKELCNIAFDLSYAMFGMESKVYPVAIGPAAPFDENYMTLAKRSDPNGSVSWMVFPSFLDSNNKLYFKSKVWYPRESTLDLIKM